MRRKRSKGSVVAAALLAAIGALASAAGAIASPLAPTRPPPANCLDYARPSIGANGLYDWRDTLAVEHCDRIKRLWDIALASSAAPPPQFFDGYVSAAQLPTDVGVDLPMLRVVFPDRVFFDTAEADLRPEAQDVVRIVARNLQLEPPDVVLFVAGHTDSRGDRDYNYGLSIRRANAVAEAILSYGVNVAKVWRIGFGEDMPLRAGDYEGAWGQNRRVEFLFAARADAVAAWLSDAQLDMLCQGRSVAEANDCIRQLDLRNDYVAVETSQRHVEVSGGHAPVRINPAGTTRIIINPVNRRAGPVESN